MNYSRQRYERDSAVISKMRIPIPLLEIIEPLERVEAVAPDDVYRRHNTC
jgi:hypothetical protein